MTGLRVAPWVVVAACIVFAPAAHAQSPPVPGRFEVGFGTVWIGQAGLGSSDANETTSGGTTSRLFSSATTVAGNAGIEGRVAVRVTQTLEAEAAASYTHPPLETAISADTENNSPVTVTERLDQFIVGGGVLWYVPRLGLVRLAPFAIGSIAYLRQLHEGRTLTATGRVVQAGGGVKYTLASRSSGFFKGFGVRADARLAVRAKGVAFDDRARYSPALGASVFVRF